MSSTLRRSARIAARACSSTSITTTTTRRSRLTPLTLITPVNIIGSQLRPQPSVRAATAFFHPTTPATRKPRKAAAARTTAPAFTAASAPGVDAVAVGSAAALPALPALSALAPPAIDSGPISLLASIRNAHRHYGRADAADNGMPGPSTALQVAPTPVDPVTVQAFAREDEYPSDDEDEVIAIAPRVDYSPRAPRPRKRVTWADDVNPATALWRTGVKWNGADFFTLTPVTKMLENPLVWESTQEMRSNWIVMSFTSHSYPSGKANRVNRVEKAKLKFTDGIKLIVRRTPDAIAGRRSAIKFLGMRQDDPRLTQKWGDEPWEEQHIKNFDAIKRGQPVPSKPAPIWEEMKGWHSRKAAYLAWFEAERRSRKGKLEPFMAASHLSWRLF